MQSKNSLRSQAHSFSVQGLAFSLDSCSGCTSVCLSLNVCLSRHTCLPPGPPPLSRSSSSNWEMQGETVIDGDSQSRALEAPSVLTTMTQMVPKFRFSPPILRVKNKTQNIPVNSWSPSSCHPTSLAVRLLASLPSSSLSASFLISKWWPVCRGPFAPRSALSLRPSSPYHSVSSMSLPPPPTELHASVPTGHLRQGQGVTATCSIFLGPS